MLAILLDQLIGLADRKPELWVIEDAHWIDPTILELIELDGLKSPAADPQNSYPCGAPERFRS
jgi:hypothetical protein